MMSLNNIAFWGHFQTFYCFTYIWILSSKVSYLRRKHLVTHFTYKLCRWCNFTREQLSSKVWIVTEKVLELKILSQVELVQWSSMFFTTTFYRMKQTFVNWQNVVFQGLLLNKIYNSRFSLIDAVSTVENTFTWCEPCIKNVLIITFILVTFDLVTDWINWQQWP